MIPESAAPGPDEAAMGWALVLAIVVVFALLAVIGSIQGRRAHRHPLPRDRRDAGFAAVSSRPVHPQHRAPGPSTAGTGSEGVEARAADAPGVDGAVRRLFRVMEQ